MVSQEAPYPDVYTDTFIFFLRSLCKIIWMNVNCFQNVLKIEQKSFYNSIILEEMQAFSDSPFGYTSHIPTYTGA